uniref:Carboxypeptidase n=1 Tax=Panagrolaimus superbus TaxID=310955 RepID=A0A914YV67_9BILA
MHFFVALILATFVGISFAVDEIKRLPGVKFNVTFKHYSGYLQVSKTHFLHYWFVESQNDPAKDPLIFWYNGGPGCSSLLGLLTEMGPYEINSNAKTLHENPNSWNKFASVVYMEAPAGVGFSFSSDGNTTTNDDQTAQENYEGIKQFFTRHPGFRNHSTFIMGESYGGIYLPTLTSQILDGQNDYPIKLEGIAIGNGLLSDSLNDDTALRYMYYHGLIDETSWTEIEQKCCNGCVESCSLANLTGVCESMVSEASQNNYGLNPYNIYDICDPNSKFNPKRFYAYQKGILPKRFYSTFFKDDTKTNGKACMKDTEITSYLNLPSVRRALNIPKDFPEWVECGGIDEYQKQYDDMTPFFKKILKAKIPILLYYGDVDMVCNFMQGQKFVAQLKLSLWMKQKAWKVNEETSGFITLYKGLSFATIRGAGHMAPGWKAPETSFLINTFVNSF